MENRVRILRCARQMSIRKLYEITGISPSYIHYIETGRKKPSVYHAQRLAHALQTTVEDLFPLPLDSSAQPVKEKNGRDL